MQTPASPPTTPQHRTHGTERDQGRLGPPSELRAFSMYSAAAVGRRWTLIVLLIGLIAISHWALPMSGTWTHAAHILLRKCFMIPILVAAISFGLGGASLTAALVTTVYVPYFLLAWSGDTRENLNQMGEILTFWIIALLAGWLAGRERAALQQTADMSRDALNALIAALDAREHQTEQHSLRVADMAFRMGERLGLGKAELEILHRAAVLHDVGKIGVPDSVLLKPGPLDPHERQVMERHAEMGYEILLAAEHLREVAEVVHAHHERFDGTGYPRGLSGEEIPRGARIFAIADVYDALTSDRPYRAAMPASKAVTLISESAGAHFDPVIVEEFVNMQGLRELRR